MKYTSNNKPLVCMQTTSACYKETEKMTIKGVLWHSTGANNPTLKRYVQPSDNDAKRSELLKLLGTNNNKNDWNHIYIEAGLNYWIGKLADGTVAAVQSMPDNYRPWGCGSGSKGSCNDGWIQFEICEDALTDKNYFNAVYKEACELTAYLCKTYNLNPTGTTTHKGVTVPVILCHADSYKLGLGSNHGDVLHWFKKHGKTMDNVRADVKALIGTTTTTTTTTTTVKTYKVVKTINKYASAGDAKSKKNSKGTYAAGTYYIYNKYPNGSNGMYNISTDKTGNSAGGWINPDENKVEQTQTEESKIYRVRKTWADAKSQVGAYGSLDNAKNCCQNAGSGYHVFDWDGKIVYSYVAPVTPTPAPVEPKQEEVTPKKVYELDFPSKNKICGISKLSDALHEERFTQVCESILKNNASFDINIAKAFFTLAPIYTIDPVRAISQSILETGWFKYVGSAVELEHHNYCGLGVTVLGKPGNIFKDIETGVRAQLQHLFAYGSKNALPSGETLVDERFKYVTRGIAVSWEELAGRWACPGFDGDDPQEAINKGNTYGQKIDRLYKSIVALNVSQETIEKYFKKVEPQEPVDDNKDAVQPEVQPDTPPVEPPHVEPTDNKDDTKDDGIDTDKVNKILDFIIKAIQFIVDFFKKK